MNKQMNGKTKRQEGSQQKYKTAKSDQPKVYMLELTDSEETKF